MSKKAETPQDANYLWAKSGYDLFVASSNLAARYTEATSNPLSSDDLVKYMGALCGYALNEFNTSGNSPAGIRLETLQSVDTILRRIDKGILGTSVPKRNQLSINGSLLRGIKEILCLLLDTRAHQLEVLLSHMEAEGVPTMLVSTQSPYYQQLLSYHRNFVEDEPEYVIDINTELAAVLGLLESIGGQRQPRES